ncbi:MAG: glycosyltransferase [Pseudonocardiaceae bacterium]
MEQTGQPETDAIEPGQRLIDWTGERCVPWTDDVQVIYEHYHRYALAGQFTAGKRILDLACGEGYGAALLAAEAREVVGLDNDPRTIEHARANYEGKNLVFELASMVDPDALSDQGGFDVITCFEALEHVEDQDALMALVRRKLAPGGLFLTSTPDTEVYSHDHGNENPFHVKELTEPEFRALLNGSFGHVAVLRQNAVTGSVISADRNGSAAGGPALAQTLRRRPGGWELGDALPHTYLLGIASDGPLPQVPDLALLVDPDLAIVRLAWQAGAAGEREHVAHALELYRTSREEVDELKRSLSSLESLRVEQENAARRQIEQLESGLTAVQRRSERAESRASWASEISRQAEQRAAELEEEVAALRAQQSAVAQRLIGRYRSTIERSAPRGTKRRDLYERALGRRPGLPLPDQVPGPVVVTTSDTPLVSVIVPVHGKWAFTRACLGSIEANRPAVPFEVIVVDDASPDRTADEVSASPGVRLVRTDRNVGFVGASNLGAGQARGEYLLFLNNDTEVHPGWLDELVATADSDDRIGLIGAKLVYPDGRLQECGGIVWSDGTGWNYGRNGDPDSPEFQALRDVDYCSGAAILVRRDVFEQVGGFDDRYAPAYYEDTDLAFAVRSTGHRTVVQPRAIVTHHEGVSHGTDASTGGKRYQELNRAVFVEKWAAELAHHCPSASSRNVWLGRQRGATGHEGGLVLVADHQVPTPDRDSGSARLYQLLLELTALGERIVFFPSNGAALRPYTEDLQRHGITVIFDPAGQAAFLREAGDAITLAVLSRPAVAWRLLEELRELAPACLIAYDTVDLHFLRLERQAELVASEGGKAHAAAIGRKAAVSRELELALVRSTDLTLVVSEFEQRLLQEVEPKASVRVLSNVHSVRAGRVQPRGREGILFVGSFDHLPNRDAARWMATDVMPLVHRRRPQATLHIVGSNPSPDVLDLAAAGVEVHGWVPDLAPLYLRHRVSVAPLRFGAGVKGKVGDSVGAGLPTVCTSTAVEGMQLTPGEDVLVADDAEPFADAVVALLENDSLWQRISDAGPAAIRAQFGPATARGTLQDILAIARGTSPQRTVGGA